MFMEIKTKEYTLDDLKAFVDDNKTKRLCFDMDNQRNPLKDGKDDVIKWLNLPFHDSIAPIIKEKIGIDVHKNKNGRACYPCKSKEEVNKIEEFIDSHRNLVFMRDYLELSVCLSMHELDVNKRTETGDLIYKVKYCDNVDSKEEKTLLKEKLQSVLTDLPYFKQADYICAIPSSKTFVKEIILKLTGFNFEDISKKVYWDNKQTEIKNETDAKTKLDLLAKSVLKFSDDLDLKDKNVLLIDDLYSSGMTIQYVALRMKEAGVRRVFGISFVKALKNS